MGASKHFALLETACYAAALFYDFQESHRRSVSFFGETGAKIEVSKHQRTTGNIT